MIKRRLAASALAAAAAFTLCASGAAGWTDEPAQADALSAAQAIALNKSDTGNPVLGFDGKGALLYGGDPAILVDGDTVYAYVGHDTSTNESYYMPDWQCYSTRDLKSWTYEGQIMAEEDISWGNGEVAAWAGQVVKYQGTYYFYYCTQGENDAKNIGVATSISPTGPFVDIGKPLVRNEWTSGGPHTWEDIDPTVWIETDSSGVEHRYLCWGNTRLFLCELNEDMTSILDRDGDRSDTPSFGEAGSNADIILCRIDGLGGHTFTEAPWLYRRTDGAGAYTGPYYLFFATDWREQMAYATTDDLMGGVFTFGAVIQEPSATGNTNHMAVFDFQGQTYFVYHDGSLPHGSGFRRVMCMEPLIFNPDGSIPTIEKTATGLTGTMSRITDSNGGYVAHVPFENPLNDDFYPIQNKPLVCDFQPDSRESEWEILPGKSSSGPEYVSIESNNKPGLYLTAGSDKSAVLSQDKGGTDQEAASMTFKTLAGLAGSGVTFESVAYPGYYLTSSGGALSFTQDPQAAQATFYVSTELAAGTGHVEKTQRLYPVDAALNVDDVRVRLYQEMGSDGRLVAVPSFTTNAGEIDMSTPGTKRLTVTYQLDGQTHTDSIAITVVDAAFFEGAE